MAKRYSIRARNPREDLTGRQFGKLTVESWLGESRWHCRCECGGEAAVLTANLKRGNSRSCGCIKRIVSSRRATTHGLSNTPAYRTWVSVKRRCTDAKHGGRAYADYGARGIKMHDEWVDDPAAFIAHVGQPPSSNYTLDRIDNDRGYEPGNVRWATPLEQGNNKRNNVWVTFQGKRYTLAQLARYIAEECGLRPKQVSRALEKAIHDPD